MAAYDFRAEPDGPRSLSETSAATLVAALRAQRDAGRTPTHELQAAITAAAAEARDSGMRPEALILHLKQLADKAGLPATPGDDRTIAIREWLVSACIQAYYSAG